jgi:hypothetical protein
MRSRRSMALLLLLSAGGAGAFQAPPRSGTGRHLAARRASLRVSMLAKKPFKGGRLDDFLDAGAAEAKYGPQRYASRYEDLRTLEVQREQTNQERERSQKVYAALKAQLLQDHAFLSLLGTALVWSLFDLLAVKSYAVGAALGAFYLYLSQRSADSFGASTPEEVKGGPPALIVPVLMVLLIAKNPQQLSFLPVFAGFATERLAVIAQLIYPSDFGVDANDASMAVK